MSTTLSRVLIATALLGAATADAGKRIVVLDFDGPRTLADNGRDAVVRALGSDNDLIAQKRWIDAKATVMRTKQGPKAWSEAAKQAGVDALVDGWVQIDNRVKVLTVIVTEATTGNELDQFSLKLGSDGFTEATMRALRKELDDRLDGIEPGLVASPKPPDPTDRVGLGDQVAKPPAPKTEPAAIAAQPIAAQAPPAQPADAKPTPAAPAQVATVPDQSTTKNLEPKNPDWLPDQPKPVSRPTPHARVAGGFGWTSRTLFIGAEEDGVTQYTGVPAKSVGVDAAFYPFPRHKRDGKLQGFGISFGVSQSLGNRVTFDDGEEVGEYSIDQHGWNAAVHYAAPLGDHFSIDGEVGYSRQTYNLDDAPETFEVPNTSYHALHIGTHVDLSITDRASVGFGGKYFHVLESGDLSSVEWYGPGSTSGLSVDGNFVVPLPARMYVRGELSYTRLKTSFDGVGVITEDEGVYEAVDSNVGINVKVGIEF